MRFSFLMIGLTFVSISVLADNVTLYRWVDKNNVVHFSQQQPSHDNFVEIYMSVKAKNKAQQPKSALKTESEFKAEQQQESNTSKLCDSAKANLRTLKAYDKIQYSDEKGQVHVLSEVEKAQQLAMNEKQVEVYCQ